MDFLVEVVTKIAQGSGFAALDIKTIIMLAIACVLLYMGIGKGFEPLLLVPIAFGMLLANLPVTGLFAEPVYDAATHSGTVGFMWVLYQGVQYAIYPSIIFMGIGAMTDFGPLLANPMSLMLGDLMYVMTGGKVNPLIGSAGVSAVPMAARVSQTVGQKENPSNFLLMHAMGPNVAGVIGSACAAGFMIKVFGG